MSTVIYLANQQIQAVTGSSGQKKVSVSKTYIAEAPEGSIINGIIMDPEAFVGFIKDFWKENKLSTKDVTLVINSSKFIGQTIELPKLKENKVVEYIDREFADLRKDDDVIYGYIPLKDTDSNMRRVYAEAIATDFIGEYIEIFKEAGIGVKEIHSGESSLIGLTEMTVASYYDTFIMMIADKVTLTTLLWVDKSFYYFNSVRCFHEQGTEDHAMDVARSVSQIIQFMKAHQIAHELQNIQIAGMESFDIRMYREALEQQGIMVPITPYDGTVLSAAHEDVQEVLHATSGLVINGKSQNFFTQYHAKNKKTKSQSGSRKTIVLIVSVFVVMFLLTLGSFVLRQMKKSEFNRSEEEVQDPAIQEQLMDYDKLLSRNDFLRRQFDAINEVNENIDSYPICDQSIVRVMQNCAGTYATVEFESFNAEEGKVVVVAKSDSVDNINRFIKELNGQEIFNDIDYTGYSFDETDKLWDIHVSCTLSEGAGR